MALTIAEMASRYVGKIPAAVAGAGGHNQTFMVACALVKGFDMTKDEARPLMQEFNGRCQPPWSDAEIEHKLNQADKIPDEEPRGYLRLPEWNGKAGKHLAAGSREIVAAHGVDYFRELAHACETQAFTGVRVLVPPPPKPVFHADRLKGFAARWREFIDTAWLADRSPENAYRLTPAQFLSAVFREGEKVVIFTMQQSQGQALWPLQEPPERGEEGVWYLAQPVDGEEHPNPRSLNDAGLPKLSRRSEESVTDWRHLVLESDEADAKDWMAALVQLPLRIVAIYTSGGRSIHALVRVDAPTKQEWDNCVRQIRPVLVTLGADPKAMSAVRLSRLPGCMRAQKLQKLLYLNPEPAAAPIVSLPRARDVIGHWTAFVDSLAAYTPAQVREQVCWDMVEECRAALEWYESAPAARAMLARLLAWEGAA